ncbi:MAG: hypothetical protein DYH08_13680, partial [Actinobacteria bacterium ATB1]|nr:hypothetical protein [Actinobacteria bacterium ATB1]
MPLGRPDPVFGVPESRRGPQCRDAITWAHDTARHTTRAGKREYVHGCHGSRVDRQHDSTDTAIDMGESEVRLDEKNPEGGKVSLVEKVLGPRIPSDELKKDRWKYSQPIAYFAIAAVLLVVSIFLPYWILRLSAPQFPDGLRVHAYVNRLEGDVVEIEELNHYVGMPAFDSGAVFERSIAVISIIVIAGLLLAIFFIHNRWVLLFALPALLYPLIFIGDLQYWLWNYGHSLDPV